MNNTRPILKRNTANYMKAAIKFKCLIGFRKYPINNHNKRRDISCYFITFT